MSIYVYMWFNRRLHVVNGMARSMCKGWSRYSAKRIRRCVQVWLCAKVPVVLVELPAAVRHLWETVLPTIPLPFTLHIGCNISNMMWQSRRRACIQHGGDVPLITGLTIMLPQRSMSWRGPAGAIVQLGYVGSHDWRREPMTYHVTSRASLS